MKQAVKIAGTWLLILKLEQTQGKDHAKNNTLLLYCHNSHTLHQSSECTQETPLLYYISFISRLSQKVLILDQLSPSLEVCPALTAHPHRTDPEGVRPMIHHNL